LPEIGTRGQERLLATRVTLDATPGSDIEAEYLRRAGVQVAGEPSSAVEFPLRSEFGNDASRSVAQGAWSALRKIREALAR
jgi:hypothetical protein